LISLIIIESIKLFLSNSSIFNVSLLSINQSINNQSNHTLSTHSQIKINSQMNQPINQMNESKVVCFFDLLCLFVCFVWFVVCLFVWFKVGSLLILFINQSHQSINQLNEINQTNPTFIFTAHTILNQPMSVKCQFLLPFFLSISHLNPIQSINQKRSIDRQDRRREIDEWMNELKSISLTSQFMCNWSQRVNSILFDCLFPFPN
jgi:hypothetical protein